MSQLKKNVLSGSLLAGSGIIMMLVSYPVYLHFLGTELYGLWATLSVVMMFSSMGNLGINSAIIKYTAEEYGRGSTRGIAEYLATSLVILAVPSFVILCALFVFNNAIVGFLDLKETFTEKSAGLIPMIGILSVCIMFTDLVKGTVMGVGRVDIANYVFLAGRILQIGLSIILVVMGMGVWGLYYGALCMYTIIALVYCLILLFRYRIPVLASGRFCRDKAKSLFSFGGTMFSARVISMLLVPFNKVIVAKFIGLSEVTYFDIAYKGAIQLRNIFEMGLKAIMPKVSEITGTYTHFKERVNVIHAKGIRFILVFALPLFVILFVLNRPLLEVWLGRNYHESLVFGFRVLLAGFFCNLLCVPAYYVFMGVGKVKECFMNAAVQSILNVGVILLYVCLSNTISLPLVFIISGSALAAASLYVLARYYYWTEHDSIIEAC